MKNKNSKKSLIRKWPELLTKTNAQINGQNEALVVTIEKYFFASSRGQRLLNGFFFFVLSLTRSATSPSFDVRLHGSSSIPIASFVERSLFIKTLCHRKYLNRRIVYSCGHQGTFNPAVITKKEVHMVHGDINMNDETSHTTSSAKKKSLKISDYFSKQNWKTFFIWSVNSA